MQVVAVFRLLGDGDEAAGLAGRMEGRQVVVDDAAPLLVGDARDSSSLASASTVDAS